MLFFGPAQTTCVFRNVSPFTSRAKIPAMVLV